MDRHTVIRTESQRFADVLADTDPDARCPTCPDWSAADLLWHLTEVHSFWAGILGSDARTDADAGSIEDAAPKRPGTVVETLPLRQQATEQLLTQLEAIPDEAPRWSGGRPTRAPDSLVGCRPTKPPCIGWMPS
jgi:uncharacterized protein (TIGR03083 family)